MDRTARAALEAGVVADLEAGDLRRATTAAVRAYGPELVGYVFQLLGDRAAAEDVFAETCMDFWRSLAGFRRDCSIRTWLYKLAWNAASNYRRDRDRRRERRLETPEISDLVDEVSRSASSVVAAAERRDRIRARLERDEQSLLTLRLDRGLAWKEVAIVMADGATAADQAALRKRFERLKDKLRRMIAEESA